MNCLWRAQSTSPPLRGRGLKLLCMPVFPPCELVAPPAGAWIETPQYRPPSHRGHVAPPAGAWIETTAKDYWCAVRQVAPPAGAWIETRAIYAKSVMPTGFRSPPLRGRGLKPARCPVAALPYGVAPPAGAWIETGPGARLATVPAVAPPAGAWIETPWCRGSGEVIDRRPPCGGVD